MNRRSFIGTLTALAGVVLAKIEAPAADPLHTVTHPYWRAGIDPALPGTDHLAIYHTGDFLPDAKWFSHPDKCRYCGNEGTPGYDTICFCQPLKDARDAIDRLS